MVILKAESLDNLVLVAEVHPQGSVLCDAGEQDEFLGIRVPWIGLLENWLEGTVPDRCEEEYLLIAFLVGSPAGFRIEISEPESLSPLDFLLVLEIGWTLGDYDDVRFGESFRQIPEPSKWEKMVFMDRPVVIYKNNIKVCLESPVLESVVEDYQVSRCYLLISASAGPFFGLELFRVA